MADEKVILEVDVSSLSQAVLRARADLDMYNVALQDSIEETGKWSESTVTATAAVNAQNKAVKQAEAQLVRVTQVEKALGGSIQELVKNYKAEENSTENNRKVRNALNAEYEKSSVTQRQKLLPLLKELNLEINKQSLAVGNTKDNIGNYFNEFAKGVPQLGAAVDGVKNLGFAFTSAGGGIKGFGAALATTGLPLLISGVNLLIDAFQTFTPLAEAVEDIMGGLSAVFTSSYNEGVKLVQLKRQLEENDRNQIVTNAILKKSITELEAVAANKAAKDQDRIDALQGANKLREEQLKLQKEDAQGQLELINGQVEQARQSAVLKAGLFTALGFATQAKVNGDLLKRQQEANAKLIQLDEETGKQIRENQNKIDLLNQQIAEDKKAKEDKALAESKTRAEEQEKIDKRELDNLRNIAIENEKIRQENLSSKEREIEELKRLNDKKIADEEKAETDFLNRQREQAAQFLQEQRQNAEAEAEITRYKQQVQSAYLSFSGGIASGLIGFIGDVAEATGLSAGFAKALALVQIGINTAVALTGAILQAQSVPFPANLVAIGTGIGAVLGGIGSAIAVLKKTGNPPATPKFATGVIGLDGDGTETSDSIPAYLSKNESVMTAKATKRYHRELAYMEMSVGNKPNYQFGHGHFAGGFIPQVSSDGGFVAREALKQSDMGLIMREAIRSGFALAPATKLSIVEYETKKANMERSVAISEA